MSQLLIHKEERGVVHLTLNREAKRNAFDDVLIAEFVEALTALAADTTVKVLVLKGAGSVFCAGADLNWMQRMAQYTFEQNQQDADQLAELMYRLNAMPQPVIAVVQGAAFAGGMGLLACCDIVLATPETQFCLSEVKLGLIPAVIAPFLLARMGAKATRRYALTAEIFSAQEAKAMHLIDEIVEDRQLQERSEILVQQLLKNSSAAMQAMKSLLRDIDPLLPAVREKCVQAIAKCRVSQEAQERMQKFLTERGK